MCWLLLLVESEVVAGALDHSTRQREDVNEHTITIKIGPYYMVPPTSYTQLVKWPVYSFYSAWNQPSEKQTWPSIIPFLSV